MILNINTKISYHDERKAVINAVSILERDIKKRFSVSAEDGKEIVLVREKGIEEEDFIISASDDRLTITADDELGFVYGLLYISEKFLGIKPFWFWLDQKVDKTNSIVVENGEYKPQKPAVKYRGWFINDEVLIAKWSINGDSEEPWRMAFEALLRCGGNIVIPGTDKNSRIHRRLASDMGLWITQHHAEPLGAEMFIREYPGLNPNYFEHKELFHKLWEDAIEEQKDMKVIWSLGFRGQGDCPFWASDTSGQYDTDEKRGALISEIIELQRQMVLHEVSNPVFCTNLYGEVMELFDGGFVSFDDNIIKVSADNGFGKMVTRRRSNHTARISAMPKAPVDHGGIYYHVSFYDLQAANHITMLPNSVKFVNDELNEVRKMNMMDFWVINCSNIRPHAYFLNAVAKKWYGEEISDAAQSAEFAAEYYDGKTGIAECLADYHKAMIVYGPNEDEHAGEQFYTENTRLLANMCIRNNGESCGVMKWFTGDVDLSGQIMRFSGICRDALPAIEEYLDECEKVSETLTGETKDLFDSVILLQAKLHYHGCKGAALFSNAYSEYQRKNYFGAFMILGDSAAEFEAANTAMRSSEKDVWQGYYYNECFADYKHTAYVVRKFMGVVREIGDNVSHWKWQREILYSPEDRGVLTLLLWENHLEDQELYEAAKQKIGNGEYRLPID
ncbi:MAG: glycosyl hydrolase 115 family protein [Oscillospiraceae bacterium]|nr:glycosyl hydrolase 115 family protein [Oscillospiraceae bacterium]